MVAPKRRMNRWVGLPTEDRQAERRALLVEAAFELTGEEGEAATTVRAVCERARLNPRYFYENFVDRDELLVAVYDRQIALLGEEITRAMAAVTPDDPAAVVRATIGTIVRFVADDPRQARVLYTDALGNEAVARRRLDTNLAVIEATEQWARAVWGEAPEGERIGRVAAATLVGGLHELVLYWLEGQIDVTLDQLIDDAVELFIATAEASRTIAERRSTRGHSRLADR